ncbi:MAG: AAA family ATPase, partial [Candidatus Methanomethylophilaceae archaeon]|nr:AAA family ATPase [Candidatus Methanomethylophilaceae archaeon]
MQRINGILECLNDGLIEREETVSMALLSILSGHSVFLYGPPGTAKSLIASRIASAFEDIRYFEYLMQRFSTPEEVFGPISISELRNDNYKRMIQGFLPDADLAFLDEIWKSSPAILNTLLTIINEHKFRNGTTVSEVP